MKKILVLMLTFVMLFSLAFIVSATDNQGADIYVAQVGENKYTTIDEAIANWTNNTTLTLLSDVTLTGAITLKSTECHTINLSTFTLTGASGNNVFEITACGTGAQERTALVIKADANNPGSINAGSKAVVFYDYSKGTTTGDDRPIIQIDGGILNGSTSTYFGTGGIHVKGTASRKCATIKVNGGTLNCSIRGATKSKLIITGGTFNAGIYSQGDSTANRLIYGGRFKKGTLTFFTADSNNTKFWFGTKMGQSNVGMYIDKEGYLVVCKDVITEAGDRFQAHSTSYSAFSNYLQYSSAATYGLFYETVDQAFQYNNKTSGNVTVFTDTLDMTGVEYKGSINVADSVSDFTLNLTESTYAGKINVTNDDTVVYVLYDKKNEPACTVESAKNGKIVIYFDVDILPLVYLEKDETEEEEEKEIGLRNYLVYENIQDAINEAIDGDVLTLIDNVVIDSAIVVPNGKNITIDMAGFTITSNGSALNVLGNLTINGEGTITGTVEVNSGASLELNNVTITADDTAISVKDSTLTINNATVTSSNAIVADNATLTIKNGSFDGTVTGTKSTSEISGGTFTKPISSQLLTQGYAAKETDGKYVIGVASVQDFIVFQGYSVCEASKSVIAGYTIDKVVYEGYCKKNNTTLELGIVYAANQIDEKAIYTSLNGYSLTTNYTISLKNLKDAHLDRAFAMALYVVIDGEKQFVTCNESGATVFASASEVIAITYNSVASKEENQ